MKSVELRPSVLAFAQRMESVLREHDAAKGGQDNWRQDDPGVLFGRLADEVAELREKITGNVLDYPDAAREAIDVANFAMMIADVCQPLPSDAGGGR